MALGDIFYHAPSFFAWELVTNSSFNEFVSCVSPDFKYNGHKWCLQLFVLKNVSGTSLKLRLCSRNADDYESFTQSYSLGISDVKRAVDWTSSVLTDKFGPIDYGTFQEICFIATDPHKDVGRTPFENREWTIRLRFGTTKERRQPEAAVDLKEANSHSRFSTEAGTQTCSDGTVQLSRNFKDLFLKGHKTDVTLKVEGTEFEAHKVILSARSPVFEKMFDHDMLEETSGSVTITDCEPEDFHTFLLYLYTGKVEKPTVKSSVGLYCLADKYNVEGLAPYCVQFLLSNFSVESYCDIVSLGLRHCDTELMTSAKAFFARNLEQIIRTEQWKYFNSENPAEASDILIQGISQVNLVPK